MIRVIVTKEFRDDLLTNEDLLHMVMEDQIEFFDQATWEFERAGSTTPAPPMTDRLPLARVRQLAEGNHGPDVKALATEVLESRERITALLEDIDASLEQS